MRLSATTVLHVDRVIRALEHAVRYGLVAQNVAKLVDFSGERWDGVFAPLADPSYFAKVFVDPVAGTITWPNGADMAPEVLYAEVRAAAGAA